MKNVNGLANAMRLVESACEKDEITIIGESATPTAVELYKKCVVYINKQYGVDILNLVLKEQKPCECNGSCTTVIVEADEDEDEKVEVYIVDNEDFKAYVETYLSDKMPYLSQSICEDILGEILDFYKDNVENEPVEDYSRDYCADNIYDIFYDLLYITNYDEDYLGERADEIAKLIEENGLEKEYV